MSDLRDAFPTLSVVIPTYNRASLLPAAIVSVREQRHPALELIVVDDGSTDTTQALLRARNDVDVVIHQRNAGPAAARNAGIRRARGEWIGFLDSDDLWTPDALCLHAKAADGVRPVVWGRSVYQNLDGSAPDPSRIPMVQNSSEDGRGDLNRMWLMHFGSALFHCALFERVGLLDASLRLHEDHEFFLRMGMAGIPMLRHEGLVQVRRLHEQNLTRDVVRTASPAPRFLKCALDLRRGK